MNAYIAGADKHPPNGTPISPSWLTLDELEVCRRSCGDSFYVFHQSIFTSNFTSLQTEFARRYPNTRIAYSYKTNYTPAVCRAVNALGGYAEVVSEMEFNLARSLSVDGPRIVYNGPCKSPASIRQAMQCGALINIDSIRDYENVQAVAREMSGIRSRLGIRCNFPMQDREPSRFGIDVNGREFPWVVEGIRSTRNLQLAGLHCHFPDRDLKSFQQRTSGLLEIVRRVFPGGPEFIDIGGGFFGKLPDSLRKQFDPPPPAYSDYAEVVGDLCAEAFGQLNSAPLLLIEPGTALVANSFRFYTRVLETRNIGTRRIATVAGSIQNISPHARSRNLPVQVVSNRPPAEYESGLKTDIAGYTCMESDLLSLGLCGRVEPGDFLEYANVGSYSIVMKPPFILPNVPVLMLETPPRTIKIIKHQEKFSAVFQTFPDISDRQSL